MNSTWLKQLTKRSPQFVVEPPLSATRTPIRPVFTGSASGLVALSQIDSPFDVPSRARSRVPRTALPFASSRNVTFTLLGWGSGTATGSELVNCFLWNSWTRACELMNGTLVNRLAARKNSGRSVSVSLASIIPDWHGGAVLTVSSTGEDWL